MIRFDHVDPTPEQPGGLCCPAAVRDTGRTTRADGDEDPGQGEGTRVPEQVHSVGRRRSLICRRGSPVGAPQHLIDNEKKNKNDMDYG